MSEEEFSSKPIVYAELSKEELLTMINSADDKAEAYKRRAESLEREVETAHRDASNLREIINAKDYEIAAVKSCMRILSEEVVKGVGYR